MTVRHIVYRPRRYIAPTKEERRMPDAMELLLLFILAVAVVLVVCAVRIETNWISF